MRNLHHRPPPRHGHHDATLFEWLEESDWRAASPAARHIARRFGIPLATARVVAWLAFPAEAR